MVIQQKDFYSKEERTNRNYLMEREIKVLKILGKALKPGDKFLDIGCGDGFFMTQIKKRFPKAELFGLDYSEYSLKKAKDKGLKVKWGDLNKGINYEDESFDAVYAGEVIEHLYNPDFFLQEANRVLKKGGFIILSTPNLCAWFNRIIFPLGIYPVFMEASTESRMVGAGPLKSLKAGSMPVGHIRIFNVQSLKDILELNRFKTVELKGAVFDSYFPKPFLLIDRIFTLFPTLSSDLVIVGKKINLSSLDQRKQSFLGPKNLKDFCGEKTRLTKEETKGAR